MLLVGMVVLLCGGCFGPQWAHSDAHVVNRIGWWPYQEGLKVTNFSIEVVDAPLHLFNSKALIRMYISGTACSSRGWRPIIKEVHIGERFDPNNVSLTPVADFLVTPIIEVRSDKKYSGEPLAFNLKVETHFQTFGWGPNLYHIQCAGFCQDLTLHQRK
jgi:hypothetical protein